MAEASRRRRSMGSPIQSPSSPVRPLPNPHHPEEPKDALVRGLQVLEVDRQLHAIIAQLEDEMQEELRHVGVELAEDDWKFNPQDYFASPGNPHGAHR
jgi:hypothetical protein